MKRRVRDKRNRRAEVENLGKLFKPERVPVVCFIGAGRSVEELQITEWRQVAPFKGKRPSDRIYGARVSGNSLTGDNIEDGDYVFFRVNFEQHEVTPGRLCAVWTPYGFLMKHVYPTLDGHVRLVSSNPDYEDLLLDAEEVVIEGVSVCHQHNH